MILSKNKLIDSNNGNVFLSYDYLKYQKSIGNDIWYFKEESMAIPVVILKRYFFRIATFPVEIISDKKFNLSEEREFLELVLQRLKIEGIDWAMGTEASSIFPIYPNNSLWIPFGSYVVDLTLEEDELWKRVHSKHRNVIRKAKTEGVIIRECHIEDLQDYMYMDEQTWNRSGKKSLGTEFYKLILDNMKDHARCYIAYYNEKPQGGAIIYFGKDRAYYMYGVSLDRPVSGAMNFLQWNIILELKKEGIKEYSFVGCRINEDKKSKYHGIQQFKKRFGGELREGYLFKIIFKNWKYNLFCELIKIKNFSNKAADDIIDQEWNKWHKISKEQENESFY